jgi:hypothetical protein
MAKTSGKTIKGKVTGGAGGGGTVPGKGKTVAPVFTLGTDLKTLQEQRAHALQNVNKKNASKGWTDRLNNINAAIAGMPAAEQPPITENPAVVEDPAKQLPGLGQSFDDWYKGQASGYSTRSQLANDELNRKLAAQGLQGSGRELELSQQISDRLGAEAQQAYRGEATQNMDRAQRDSESMRNWLTDMLGIAAGQSNMATGSDAAGQMSSDTNAQGGKEAGKFSTGGGGGYVAPPKLDSSGSSSLDISKGLGTGQQIGSMVSSIFSKLFPSYGK